MKTIGVFCLLIAVCLSQLDLPDNCRNCICDASGCEANIGCDRGTPEACGPYAITLEYYCDSKGYMCDLEDPNNIIVQEWKTCTVQWECSNLTVDTYMFLFAEPCYGPTPTCQQYAELHKGGYARTCNGTPPQDAIDFGNTVVQCCVDSYQSETC